MPTTTNPKCGTKSLHRCMALLVLSFSSMAAPSALSNTISSTSPPTEIAELGVTVETVNFVNVFDEYDSLSSGITTAIRVISIEKESPLYPDIEPGFITWANDLEIMTSDGQTKSDGWVKSAVDLQRRWEFVKAENWNLIGQFGIIVPKQGVDWKTASFSDYEAATMEGRKEEAAFKPPRLTTSVRFIRNKSCDKFSLSFC